ncbi:MAG: hypothetical protein ACHBN1_35375 [Heteroscytonema crispum UTEX LB 1556]
MNDDNLTIYDIEQSILTGEIVERQKDRSLLNQNTVSEAQAQMV